ncbi:ABC transporter permease [Kitasatospora kifunensis]|uniref:Peptide/nickel transport system permease protein/oligopeptide transport system permease protein n=1 Tax=Kitasatospora kifunensis TaxID=58351 RepID=A0A7W7R871_KITKI|nr:ABC transporter permease [Kitasatospora kifunensis]MBB4927217.1 peptide/nickel transport system permease protein/oligopeptide transport system permease protein [Kitasatospora kifunensis]
MGRYLLRRLLYAVPVLLATTFLIHTLVFVLPGDPIQALAGDRPVPPSVVAELHRRYHLDDPLFVQYARYLRGLLSGDLGRTFTGEPVANALAGHWLVTLRLGLTAWFLETVLGIGLGVWAALRRGRWADRAVLGGTTLASAVPVYILGYLAQLVLGVRLGWFPVAGAEAGWPTAYLLPGLVLASFGAGYVARLTRSSVLESLSADYVRTATAKGLSRRRTVVVHALRNSLVPVVTFLGIELGSLLAGAVVTEYVFNLPGIGQQVFQAIQLREGPTVVGITTVLVLVFCLANLAVDLLYGLLDPRIRHD